MEWRFVVCARNVALGIFPMQATAYASVQKTPGFVRFIKSSDAYSEALFKDEHGNHFIMTVVMVKTTEKSLRCFQFS